MINRTASGSSSAAGGNNIKGTVDASLPATDLGLHSNAVVARFRPQNKIELANGGEPVVDFPSDDTCTINVRDQHTTLARDIRALWGYLADMRKAKRRPCSLHL
jgi:hypothetical protein